MSKNKKKSKCDKSEANEKVNFADVGKAVIRKDDEICKGPLYHMRNKVITEEEKVQFRYSNISTEYLDCLFDHNTAMRFMFNDQ